jgi:hypothetical protein
MISQGYALYAAVDFDGEGKPCLCLVVGWALDSDRPSLGPLCVAADPDSPRAAGGRALTVPFAKSSVPYIGTDIRQARAACGQEGPAGVPSKSLAPSRPQGGERYARGARALCGRLDVHEGHGWTPPGHDYSIVCPGDTA